MFDENHSRHRIDNEVDRALSAVLAQYAAAEPRPGLEQRILAHLYSADADRQHGRWSSGVAAAIRVAGVALATLILITGSLRLFRPQMANHPAVRPSLSRTPWPQTKIAATSEPKSATTARLTQRKRLVVPTPQPTVGRAVSPRLDQFPSPRPLTDQEKLLAGYVLDHPEQAVLVARARSEAFQRDLDELRDSDDTSGHAPLHFND